MTKPPSLLIERSLLAVILLAYGVIGALYALRTPLWQVPDEPAHYNYVAQVARNGCCPVIEPGDWDNAYLESIKAARFDPTAVGDRLPTIQYEDHQPPLYYLLAALPYNATGGDPTALRLFSIVLGAGIVLVTWGTLRLAAPNAPWLALTAAAFVAFLPQHVAMMGGINNDSLAELLVALTLFGCVAYLRADQPKSAAPAPLTRLFGHPLTLGILLGLIFLTKLTAYMLVAVIVAAILLRARTARRHWRSVLRAAALVLIPAVLIGSLWWARNVSTYGGLDITGLAAHDRVVVGQPQTQPYVEARGLTGWLQDGALTLFNSFWGQFGWMGVPMTGTIYTALAIFSLLVATGALLALVTARGALTVTQRSVIVVLALTVLLAFAQTAYYNLKFVQFQGRYLYPGLIPLAGMVAVGLAFWCTPLTQRFALLRWLPAVLSLGFAAFAVYALFRIVCPGLGCR